MNLYEIFSLIGGIDHLHYMAPLPNIKMIAIFGILSYNMKESWRNENEDWEKVEESLGVSSIADTNVQMRRHTRIIQGRPLHDYVPLYFGVHTPMQYVNTKRDFLSQDKLIVFAEVSLEKIFSVDGVVYSDGNAASSMAKFYTDSTGISKIDWSIVLYENRCFTPEYKHRKAAEVLVPDKVPVEFITRFVCLTNEVKKDLEKWIDGNKKIAKNKIECLCDPSHFYTECAGRLIPNV